MLSGSAMADGARSEALIAQAKKEVKSITPQTLKKKIDNEDDLHYKNVVFLKGGLNLWLESGYTIFSSFGEIQLAQ